jgi:hypothetical protein
MGLPPFSLALAGKTGPMTMVPSVVEDVNPESWCPLLRKLVLDPPSYRGERIERLSADVDAGQVMKTFEVLDDMMRVGGVAHVGNSQKVH